MLHVVLDYGIFSQTFVAEAMEQLEAAGWQAWVLTRAVHDRALVPFPPNGRLVCMPARKLALRGFDPLMARNPRSWTAAQIDNTLARARPALVHAHFGWSAPDAVLVARRAAVPLVVSFHGADLSVYPKLAWWDLVRKIMRRAHRYVDVFPHISCAIVPSPVVAEQLRKLGYEGPVEVIPPGVRLDRFRFRDPPRVGRERRLLFVGRLTPRKGLDVLLRALARIGEDFSGIQLEVCGDGPEREACQALARQLGIQRQVAFLGVRSQAQVAEALGKADALVLPSRTMPDGEIETLGVVLLEAMAIGVPVVATDHGGIPFAVPPDYREELVAENDDLALARQIIAVLHDSNSQQRVQVGRLWVEREFDWQVLRQRLANRYELALRG